MRTIDIPTDTRRAAFFLGMKPEIFLERMQILREQHQYLLQSARENIPENGNSTTMGE